jgi:zinc-binding alcohol dehydrogenase family protein
MTAGRLFNAREKSYAEAIPCRREVPEMKAVAYHSEMSADDPLALEDVELETPQPGPRDCRVEVRAIAINPVDIKIRQSARPEAGEQRILGWDAAAVVVDTGEEVRDFMVGDEVWYAGQVNRPGCQAEFQLVDERILAHKPRNMSFAEAAALPLTSLTAWEILFDRLELHREPQAEQRLLVTGAAGGVGSILLQLARRLSSATLIATASREKTRDWVRRMGASHVLDHRNPLSEELSRTGLKDISHAASLTHTDTHFPELVKMLRPEGRLALIDSPTQPLDVVSMQQKSLSLHWEFMFTRSLFETDTMPRQGQILSRVAELAQRGDLQSTMTRHLGRINAHNVRAAFDIIQSGQSIGKIVLEGF